MVMVTVARGAMALALALALALATVMAMVIGKVYMTLVYSIRFLPRQTNKATLGLRAAPSCQTGIARLPQSELQKKRPYKHRCRKQQETLDSHPIDSNN